MRATVMSSPNTRKRAAPGDSPMVSIPIPHHQMQQAFAAAQPDQVFRWNGGADANGFVDAVPPNANPYAMMASQAPYGQAIPAASNALARRQNSRALVPTGGRTPFDSPTEPWGAYGEDTGFLQAASGGLDEHDSIERLEEMAQRAKREAQAKRKQIPPFVQKLSSFLDESRNTELIRWSDKGDSFIVLDEDEFAKTLIPELFKHNNYASFVRQLNMYGFHKRVGLSDNSMKASERKNKSPSEYYNPYFRRGHPNLLWLINKPKSGNSKKKPGKKDEGEGESEDDVVTEDNFSGGQNFNGAPIGRGGGGSGGASELGPLQKKDLVQVKMNIERLQQQQVAISAMLHKLRQDHQQLYQQAVMFQNMHERHENSINAILNFLANVFRKSLEEQGGTHSVQDLLASIIPNAHHSGGNPVSGGVQMPQGSVVDLGDIFNPQSQNMTTLSATPKRQQRLLPPIPHGKASSLATPSSTPSPAPHHQASVSTPYQGPQMGSVTELFDTSPGDTTSPQHMRNELRTNPHEGMMKIIEDTNAVSVSGIDLPTVAAKTNVSSMSNEHRDKMLSIMAGQRPQRPSPSVSSGPTPTPIQTPVSSASSGPTLGASAGVGSPPPPPAVSMPPLSMPPTTAPPTTAAPMLPQQPASLSPIMRSFGLPHGIPPSISDLNMQDMNLEEIERLSMDNSDQIQLLTSMLGPLSPSGRIPGLDGHGHPVAGTNGGVGPGAQTNGGGYFGDVDIDQFINADYAEQPSMFPNGGGKSGAAGGGGAATATGAGGVVDGNDFDFGLDSGFSLAGTSGAGGGGGGTTLGVGGGGTGGLFGDVGDDSGMDLMNDGTTGTDIASTPTPSVAGTEEIPRNDLVGLGLQQQAPETPSTGERDAKRRRKG